MFTDDSGPPIYSTLSAWDAYDVSKEQISLRVAPLDQAKRLFGDVTAVPTVIPAASPGALPIKGPPRNPYPFNRPAG